MSVLKRVISDGEHKVVSLSLLPVCLYLCVFCGDGRGGGVCVSLPHFPVDEFS